MTPKSWSNAYSLVDEHRHTSIGALFTAWLKVGGLILAPYEYAILASLHISSYSHLSRISGGFISQTLLADFEMQSSYLASDDDLSIQVH